MMKILLQKEYHFVINKIIYKFISKTLENQIIIGRINFSKVHQSLLKHLLKKDRNKKKI